MNLLQAKIGNPGEFIEISQDGQGVKMGKANFGVVVKQVCLEYTSEEAGDYVWRFALERLASWKSRKSELRREDSYEIPR